MQTNEQQGTERAYEAPQAEFFAAEQPLNLLTSFSAEAGIQDWEEAEGNEGVL